MRVICELTSEEILTEIENCTVLLLNGSVNGVDERWLHDLIYAMEQELHERSQE